MFSCTDMKCTECSRDFTHLYRSRLLPAPRAASLQHTGHRRRLPQLQRTAAGFLTPADPRPRQSRWLLRPHVLPLTLPSPELDAELVTFRSCFNRCHYLHILLITLNLSHKLLMFSLLFKSKHFLVFIPISPLAVGCAVDG